MIIQPSREIICEKKQSEYPTRMKVKPGQECLTLGPVQHPIIPTHVAFSLWPSLWNPMTPLFFHINKKHEPMCFACAELLYSLNTQIWPPLSLHSFPPPFSTSSSSLLRPPLNMTTTMPFANAFSSSKASAPAGSPPINASDGAETPPFMTAPLSE